MYLETGVAVIDDFHPTPKIGPTLWSLHLFHPKEEHLVCGRGGGGEHKHNQDHTHSSMSTQTYMHCNLHVHVIGVATVRGISVPSTGVVSEVNTLTFTSCTPAMSSISMVWALTPPLVTTMQGSYLKVCTLCWLVHHAHAVQARNSAGTSCTLYRHVTVLVHHA